MRPYRPDDANLLATVSDFLAKIAPQLNPGDRYQALVCQHILATLGRSADAAAAAGSPSDTGAALAALCFTLAGHDGATVALALGAGFAALGSVMSVLRLAVKPTRGA